MSSLQLPSVFKDIFKPSRYKAFFGGRGSGKSHTIASVLVVKSSTECVRILCAREIQKSLKTSSKQLIVDKIHELGLDSFFHVTDSQIVGLNGSCFIFEGLRSNPEAIKSMEGIDVAWVEEASTVSKKSIELLVPTLRKPGSELWFSWNPRFPTDPVDSMFRGGQPPPRTIIFHTSHDQNPWFPDVLREELEWDQKRDPDKYAHIWLGEYQKSSEAAVFRNWKIEELEIPEPKRPYFGADWGFSVDPTVLVKCHILDQKTLYIEQEVYKVGCEVDETPALFDQIPDSRNWPIRADSARPETISYMNRNGFRIVGATKGADSVKEGVAFLKSHDIVVHPSCKHCIDELTSYSWKTDPLTDEILPILEDDHNHVIDALRYALELARRGGSNPSIRGF